MNPKIQRINAEIDKTKGKISELGAKVRELEKQRTEIENADIVEAVRGMDISLADLAAMLKKNAVKSGAATSGQVGPKSTTQNTEKQEDNE